ncbi:methylmalonyl-CoA mutase subunit beta [Maribacter sp. X9]|uniref:methylmalonyl-CoA mutase subunit beta n=1 Tax=Maribacter sp. X9 TaxID=3402159 RepID=UPI003AF35B46
MKGKTLFEDFPEVSAKAWKQKIQYELRGKDYNEEVVWDSPEGIKIKPFYHADDLPKNNQHISRASNPWKIGQVIYAGNAIMANEKARKILKKGADAIRFVIPSEEVDSTALLNNIDLNTVQVYLEMQFLCKEYVARMIKNVSNADKLYYQIDPIGHLSRSGNWYTSLSSDFETMDAFTQMPIENIFSIDLSLYENAGADMTQQLAYGFAHANEYLNRLNEKGTLDKLKSVQFKVSIGGNYFFEIAKLQALRKLWKVLAGAYVVSVGCHITAMPSKRNKTIYDTNVNMLRTTTECMSAILGGADTIFNLPYDSVYHKDNEFAERIALNQLVLLKEESYFDKVDNPAEGSYYVETLTDQLAERALVLFKAIEKEGGFLKQLKNHSVQNKIADNANKQQDRFNRGQDILVGSNKYQNELDVMGAALELYPFVKKSPRKTLIAPIIEKRLAEGLERKRLGDE